MEPVSTILLVTTLLAAPVTSRPKWDSLNKTPTKDSGVVWNVQNTETIYRIDEKNASTTNNTNLLVSKPTPIRFTSLKHELYNELDSYISYDPGRIPALADVELAKQIIDALPSGIPLPVLMRNDNGEIGMYWDNQQMYADIDVDSNGTFSFFSRLRRNNEELFLSDLVIEDMNVSWLYQHLGPLNGNLPLAA